MSVMARLMSKLGQRDTHQNGRQTLFLVRSILRSTSVFRIKWCCRFFVAVKPFKDHQYFTTESMEVTSIKTTPWPS